MQQKFLCVSMCLFTQSYPHFRPVHQLWPAQQGQVTSKIPDILQQLLKVCIHTGTVTVAGLTTANHHVPAAWSSCGTVDSAVCPPCHQPDGKGPQMAEVGHRDRAFLASLLKGDKFAAIDQFYGGLPPGQGQDPPPLVTSC